MKKNLLIFLWALAPVALLAFHFGPGQAGIAREEARASIHAALDFEPDEQWHTPTAPHTTAPAPRLAPPRCLLPPAPPPPPPSPPSLPRCPPPPPPRPTALPSHYNNSYAPGRRSVPRAPASRCIHREDLLADNHPS